MVFITVVLIRFTTPAKVKLDFDRNYLQAWLFLSHSVHNPLSSIQMIWTPIQNVNFPGLNPIKAKTRKFFCFLLKFSVFRKFFPIKIFWQNFWKNRKIFCKNPEKMDRKILMVKTEKNLFSMLPDIKSFIFTKSANKIW